MYVVRMPQAAGCGQITSATHLEPTPAIPASPDNIATV